MFTHKTDEVTGKEENYLLSSFTVCALHLVFKKHNLGTMKCVEPVADMLKTKVVYDILDRKSHGKR